ncbi:hypothetical protein WDZ92_36790, partial [Nostoc sp. NIES-2111]
MKTYPLGQLWTVQAARRIHPHRSMARAVGKLYLMIMTTSAVMSSSLMPPPVVAEAGVVIEEFGTGVEEKRIPRQVGDGISLLRLSAGSVALSMQIEEKSFETKLSGTA